jgi:hypothetical protein
MDACVDAVETPRGKTHVYVQTTLTTSEQYLCIEGEDNEKTSNIIVIQNYYKSRESQTESPADNMDTQTNKLSADLSQLVTVTPEAKQLKLDMDLVSLACEYGEVENMLPVSVSSLEDIDNLQYASTSTDTEDRVVSPHTTATSMRTTGGVPSDVDMSAVSSSATTPSLPAEPRPQSPEMASTAERQNEEMDADNSGTESEEDDLEQNNINKITDGQRHKNAALELNICVAPHVNVSPQNSVNPQVVSNV